MTTLSPLADGLFTWPDAEPRLIGSRCRECGAITFPRQSGCPRCTADAMEEHLLARTGTLWTWTSQAFPPVPLAEGKTFEPFFVGYIELPGELRVEARLFGAGLEELQIGMPMELDIIPTEVAGGSALVYAFRPVK